MGPRPDARLGSVEPFDDLIDRGAGKQKLPQPLVFFRGPGLPAVVCHHVFAFSPSSTRRRMASGRDRSAAYFSIQLSINAIPAFATAFRFEPRSL